MKIVIILYLTIVTSLIYGQNPNYDKVFDFYKYEKQNDTLSCLQLKHLKNEIFNFNKDVLFNVHRIQDSLTAVESPCYEFVYKIEPKEYFTYVISPTEKKCIDEISSQSILFVNSKLKLFRQKSASRTGVGHSETIICDYEIKNLAGPR